MNNEYFQTINKHSGKFVIVVEIIFSNIKSSLGKILSYVPVNVPSWNIIFGTYITRVSKNTLV